jgi:hypothetical protein
MSPLTARAELQGSGRGNLLAAGETAGPSTTLRSGPNEQPPEE